MILLFQMPILVRSKINFLELFKRSKLRLIMLTFTFFLFLFIFLSRRFQVFFQIFGFGRHSKTPAYEKEVKFELILYTANTGKSWRKWVTKQYHNSLSLSSQVTALTRIMWIWERYGLIALLTIRLRFTARLPSKWFEVILKETLKLRQL